MMTKRIPVLPLLAALLSAVPALADNRIVWKPYDEAAVVTVPGRAGIQTSIQFEPGERIENVAIGDSAGWQVTPNRRADLLFLKPVLPDSRTNMTVVTDRRTYLFDLTTGGKGGPVYVLRFAYPGPAPVIASPMTTPAATADPVPPTITPAPVAEAPSPAELNFAWEREGVAQLMPTQVYDDGKATYLRWPPGMDVPAILTPGPDGVDGPANYALRKDTIIIDGVPRHITLKNGKRSASLTPSIQIAERAQP